MTSQLATRCNACDTAFRVVQDQLKVSEGWVRCGRCDTVFNALERLFDLQREPLPPAGGSGGADPLTHDALPDLPSEDAAKPPMADAFSALLRTRKASGDDALLPSSRAPAPAGRTPGAEPAFGASAASGFGASTSSGFGAPQRPEADDLRRTPGEGDEATWGGPAFPHGPFETSAPASSFGPDATAGDGRFDPHADARPAADREAASVDLLLDVPGAGLQPQPQPLSGDDAARATAAAPHPVADDAVDDATAARPPTPEFVRAAERDARWRRQPVRRALLGASVVLLAALALQAAHHFRDGVAARWPAARPWLQQACDALGCAVEPPRRIGDVTVESTALSPVGAEPGTFRLSVTLRNRGQLTVALPAVDLSLTDSNGQLVARRALLPAELSAGDAVVADAAPSPTGAAPAYATVAVDAGVPVLRPDTDTRLQALLASESRVVGYTVELFYP